MKDFPETYVPSSLRDKPEREEEFMTAYSYQKIYKVIGIYKHLKDALEFVPSDHGDQVYIVHCKTDGTDEIIYQWYRTKKHWQRFIQR